MLTLKINLALPTSFMTGNILNMYINSILVNKFQVSSCVSKIINPNTVYTMDKTIYTANGLLCCLDGSVV